MAFEIKRARNKKFYVILKDPDNSRVLYKAEEFETVQGAVTNCSAVYDACLKMEHGPQPDGAPYILELKHIKDLTSE